VTTPAKKTAVAKCFNQPVNAESKRTENHYDRFRDITTVHLFLPLLGTFNYSYVQVGEQKKVSPPSWVFWTVYMSRYLEPSVQLIVLADNQRIILKSYQCKYSEGCTFLLPIRTLFLIANSETVDYQIDGDERKFEKSDLSDLRYFATVVNPEWTECDKVNGERPK